GTAGFAWGTMPTAHSYTDQLLDRQMGLLDYGSRFYDPVTARFVRADRVQGNPQGMDPYAYVGGNPQTFIDPTGHLEVEPAEAPGGGEAEGGDGSSGGDASYVEPSPDLIDYTKSSDEIQREEDQINNETTQFDQEQQQEEQHQLEREQQQHEQDQQNQGRDQENPSNERPTDDGNTSSVTYSRVQGGGSRFRIFVNSDGSISIPNKSANLNVSVGDAHADYFQGIRRPDSEIVQFDLPRWFDDFVDESNIPQAFYKSNPLNQGRTAPKLVDPTTPGTSYEFPPPWIQWIEEYATNGRIR
ncbi:MAG TPA: RHS repeat-associated core domain-containing protein, partial [Ktedonobacteraceae bacterium]|nr:RHS repeat-associated core domain-containing protein [Ktedonobacteraceae bacterium]